MSGPRIPRHGRHRYARLPREERLSLPIVGRMLQARCKPVVSLFEASLKLAPNRDRAGKPGVSEETEGPAQKLDGSYPSLFNRGQTKWTAETRRAQRKEGRGGCACQSPLVET